MSTINYTYNVIVDRFRQFADGHFQLRRFTHGEISQADLEKEAEWPWMHVKPRAINYSPGTRAFSFEVFISDLPRDKEDKTSYQAESITDCSLIFQDLINEIHLGQMFGDDVLLTRPVNSEPFVEQYTHTLTGVTGIIELNMDYDWSACSIPASWNYNTPTNSPNDGFGALQFIESLDQNGVFVSLLNDEEAPGNSYYYGTDAAGIKGWYASQAGTVTSVDLTAGTGISVSGGPITSSGSITVTNSAPDQVVALSAGTGIGVTGTYPNFTVTNSAPSSGGTVTSVAALTLGTTGTDLSSTVATGTTTPVITLNVPTASAVNRGALSSADWSTFNGKFNLPALTSGSVLFSNGTTIAQDNANLFWDDTNNRLIIGTATGLSRINLPDAGTTLSDGIAFGSTANIFKNSSAGISIFSGSGTWQFNSAILTLPTNQVSIIRMNPSRNFFVDNGTTNFFGIIGATGNVLINTTTDAGFKLDVNGTARVSGALTANTLTLIGNTLFIASATVGGLFATRYTNSVSYSGGHIFTNSTTNISATSGDNFTLQSIQGFAPTSGTATYGALAIAPTINQTGTATGITRGLYINPTLTAAADFRAIETTVGKVCLNTTSGNTMIGTTTDAGFKLEVNGTVKCGNINVGSTSNVSGITFSAGTIDVSSSSDMRLIIPTAAKGAIVSQDYSFLTSASALFEVKSTTKGVLFPRMTTTQKNAIATPASGLVVYDTTLGKLCVRGAAAWETITSL